MQTFKSIEITNPQFELKVKKEYCFTFCQIDCNKQTKHFFVNTGDKQELCLICEECALNDSLILDNKQYNQ